MSYFTLKNDNKSFLYAFLFVLLYGSGYIGAKLGFPYANPLSFLDMRFSLSFILLLILAYFTKASWPSFKEGCHIAVSGLFLQCVFSIGTWISMDLGVPPATSALIIALQPLIIALVSHFLLKHSIEKKQWWGLSLGFFGVFLVVVEQTSFNANYLTGIFMSVVGLIGLTLGNFYQKKFCSSMNIITGGAIQSLTSAIICFILTLLFSHFHVELSGQFIFALSWMSVVVSIGAISLLYLLLRQGRLYATASLFYLVPAVTAFLAYSVFGDVLSMLQCVGMLIAMLGVWFVNRP